MKQHSFLKFDGATPSLNNALGMFALALFLVIAPLAAWIDAAAIVALPESIACFGGAIVVAAVGILQYQNAKEVERFQRAWCRNPSVVHHIDVIERTTSLRTYIGYALPVGYVAGLFSVAARPSAFAAIFGVAVFTSLVIASSQFSELRAQQLRLVRLVRGA